jgi:single-strand DNA-binding protein
MSKSLNRAQIIGNLGADPEVRTVASGTKVAEFSVATGKQWTDKNGQQQEKTEWHRVVAWGFKPDKDGLAGVAERYLHKGDRVYVEGAIEYRTYEDKDGNTRYVTEIRATEIIMLGGKDGASKSAPAAAGAKASNSYDDFKAPPMEDDDDLPF